MSDEGWLGLGLSPIEKSWFSMEQTSFLTAKRESSMFDMRIYLSDNIQMYTRSVYSSLDVLKDVGGLLRGLTFAATILMYIKNHLI